MENPKFTVSEMQFLSRLFNGEVVPGDNSAKQIAKRLKSKVPPGTFENRHGEGFILGANEGIKFDPATGNITSGTDF